MYEGTIVIVTFNDLIENCSHMGIRYCEDSHCEVEPFCKLSKERKVCSPDICPLVRHKKDTEAEIRADARQKFVSFMAEHTSCRTDCENILNCDGKKCWNKYLDMYEKEQKNEN